MDDKDKLKEAVVEFKASVNPTSIARFVTKTVVRYSVSATVAVIVRQVAPEALTRKEQIQLAVSVWAVSGMAAEKAADYANHRFEAYHEMLKKLTNKPTSSDDAPRAVPSPEVPTE